MPKIENRKSKILLLLFIFVSIYSGNLLAQNVYIPDDYYPNQSPSQRMQFYINDGQLAKTDGTLASEIVYYTMGGGSNLFLANEAISLVGRYLGDREEDPDELIRIDVEPIKQEYNQAMEAHGISDDHLNFYYPHCPQGVTNIHGHDRIVYTEYFDNIDLHLTSNSIAPKLFFVVHPGGNPSDIQLQFSGQDYITTTLNNRIQMYLEQRYIELPQLIAYQTDASGTVISNSWMPVIINAGSGILQFNVGSYNQNEYLVLEFAESIGSYIPMGSDNNIWSTYYGGDGDDEATDITADNQDNIYTTGISTSTDLPTVIGLDQTLDGSQDAFLIKFDDNTFRQWATYLGGDGSEKHSKIAINNSNIVISGYTDLNNFPTLDSGIGYYDDDFGLVGGKDKGYLCRFNDQSGQVVHSTYLGDTIVGTQLLDIEFDENTGNLFVVGNGKIPIWNGTSTNNSTGGIIAEFSSQLQPIWSSNFVSGVNTSSNVWISAIDIDQNGNIFLGGYAFSNTFTAVNLTNNSNTFIQSTGSLDDGFLAKLDAGKSVLWATYYGGSATDYITDIKLDINDNLWVCGWTNSTDFNTLGTNITSSLGGNLSRDGVFMKFDNDGVLLWASYASTGGNANEIVIDYQDNVYFTGFSQVSSFSPLTWQPVQIPQYFIQNQHNGDRDAYLVAYTNSTQLKWKTYYGGNMNDKGNAMCISSNNRLYMVGSSNSTLNFPWTDQLVSNSNNWFEDILGGGEDTYIAKFALTHLPTSTHHIDDLSFNAEIFPVINQGNFTISITSKEFQSYKIVVYNTLGQHIYSKLIPADYKIKQTLNIGSLTSGLHYVSIYSSEEMITKKVLFQD